jgi:hypothetical protein
MVKEGNKLKVDYTLSYDVTGEAYTSYAGALAYALAQSPDVENSRLIQLPAGMIDEDIEVHSYVMVKGQ